jgi:serine protease Do
VNLREDGLVVTIDCQSRILYTELHSLPENISPYRRIILMKKFFVLSVVFVLIGLAGCGGNEPEVTIEPAVEAAPTAEPTAVVEPTETAVPGLVSTLPDVQKAVIRIQAEGTFIDPEVGLQLNSAGQGSGFIIDPSGIAVTNNHVVTGAALLKVWVGDDTQPKNARVLGVSECSDLAVIDIDGDGYPFMNWYEGAASVGTDVYAAGYPLFGNTEFTLTRGIVSKAAADGETSWASVDGVLEHDATINPGNSGGPLVSGDGRIIGINYAGDSNSNQYFAIASSAAQSIVEQMRAGENVNSIGVNGSAVNDGQNISGVWVSSVKSGSPADVAGVKGGDIITAMEGLILATDGTMADYCDILRSHNDTDTLNLTVLRFDTQEVLEGQLNGRVLEPSFSFAQSLESETANAAPAGSDEPAGGYTGYTAITDNAGVLTVEVPDEWRDVDGSAWAVENEEIGWSVTAAPSLDDFYSTWTTPGMFFGASTQLAEYTPEELLDFFDYSSDCTNGGRDVYEDNLYSGSFDLWQDCGGTDTLFVVVSAKPESGAYSIVVSIQVVSDADLAALDQILNTFVVNE